MNDDIKSTEVRFQVETIPVSNRLLFCPTNTPFIDCDCCLIFTKECKTHIRMSYCRIKVQTRNEIAIFENEVSEKTKKSNEPSFYPGENCNCVL